MTSIPKSAALYSCTIALRGGQEIAVANAVKYGSRDDGRAALYGQFVHDLHKRIPKSDRERIRFHAGNTEGRQRILAATPVIAGLLFIGVPLAFLLYFRELEILWCC